MNNQQEENIPQRLNNLFNLAIWAAKNQDEYLLERATEQFDNLLNQLK
jgi:hypothetical protein